MHTSPSLNQEDEQCDARCRVEVIVEPPPAPDQARVELERAAMDFGDPDAGDNIIDASNFGDTLNWHDLPLDSDHTADTRCGHCRGEGQV